MNEKIIKDKLRVSINHLNNRKLTFNLKTFPINKTICEIFNIYTKVFKEKLKTAINELKIRKTNCDICSEAIDQARLSLLYNVDITTTTFLFEKIEVCCSKCYMIRNFSLFSNELYENEDPSAFLNFSTIYEHYYNVNNLNREHKNILINDINIFFSLSVLAKNIRWKYSTSHDTLDEFLDSSMEGSNKLEKIEVDNSKEI
ncbi:conserved Plasmodium protein, unknown function [Plasmodium vinckei brucechwatti]|uniref:Uncharacterized protein n=1 Tax=Plasmodium vinckei brucechwatti TaxID=119398 RepID=A0A6V7S118_PLAVN|nr:conserved Plasmodium protein, unknown function [Plasmodium vinckei brucechwatti]